MLRPGRPEDAAGVAEVYLAVWRAHGQDLLGPSSPATSASSSSLGPGALAEQTQRFGDFLRTRKRHFLLAETPAPGGEAGDSGCGGLCGFVSYGPSFTREGYGEVMQLYVHPKWQGRGIGSGLLLEAWENMGQHSWAAGGSHVWCTKGNPANRVYEKAGWAPTGREKSLQPSLSTSLVEVSEYCAPGSRPRLAAASAPALGCVLSRTLIRARMVAAGAACLALVLALALAARSERWHWLGQLAEGSNTGRAVHLEPPPEGGSCLDGSGPRYYHRPGRRGRPGERRWLLYFQGGGWCVPGTGTHAPFPPTLVDRCGERAKSVLGSTRSDSELKNFSVKELFSQDEEENSIFHDWHAVFLRYCDGASFADAAGLANFHAILRSLLALGLSSATDVVVSGCSAGAVAAALHAGAVQRAVPEAFVTALVDSGLFPDWLRHGGPEGRRGMAWPAAGRPPEGVWPLDVELRRVFAERGLETAGGLPVACLKMYEGEAWKCLFLEYLLPFVEVPSFVLQSRFDFSNVRGIDSPSSLASFGASVAFRLTRALEESGGRHALFLDSCFHHCMSWGAILARSSPLQAPLAQPAAFAAWWHHHRARWHGDEPTAAAGPWLWDQPPGNGSGPCWESSCCPFSDRDLSFWREGFSEAAGEKR